MSFEQQFELPLNFIEQKKAEQVENNQINGFIGNLYASYNFEMYKLSKLNEKPTEKKKLKQQGKPSDSKQLQSIKKLIRASNLKEKQTLQYMNKEQRRKQYTEKNRVRHRLEAGRQLQQPHQHFEYVDIINVERPNKAPKSKGVTYVDNNKMKHGDRRDEQGQQCMVTETFGKGYNLVAFGDSYKDQKAMYEINKTIHEKSTYRFNVLWWEKEKKTQMERKRQLQGQNDKNNDAYLDPEVRKQLKKHLKPLRRHKLVSTKYAPFSQFMNCYEGTREGEMKDSSQSEEQMEAFKEYDRRLEAEANPPGAIDLQQSQAKRKKKSKKTTESQSEASKTPKRSKPLSEKPNYVFQNDLINPKLKRALRKMKDNDWKEDPILNRGQTQEKPIEIE